MAELIATGTTTVSSAEFSLTAADQVTLSLKSATDPLIPMGANADVFLKTSAGTFVRAGNLNEFVPVQVLSGVGTYKVTRNSNAVAFGVDKQ